MTNKLNVHDIRRENLKKIAAGYKQQKDLADALGMAPAYLNNLISFKNMGERTARNIEHSLGLPAYCLDQNGDMVVDNDKPSGIIDSAKLAEAIELVESVVSENNLSATESEKAVVAAIIYEDLISREIPTRKELLRMLRVRITK